MKKKKTFDIEIFRILINDQLANKNNSQDAKSALCVALERILFDSGNYHGFNCNEWTAFIMNGGNFVTQEGYVETEFYSRHYY